MKEELFTGHWLLPRSPGTFQRSQTQTEVSQLVISKSQEAQEFFFFHRFINKLVVQRITSSWVLFKDINGHCLRLDSFIIINGVSEPLMRKESFHLFVVHEISLTDAKYSMGAGEAVADSFVRLRLGLAPRET
jgi:hypothetical protein